MYGGGNNLNQKKERNHREKDEDFESKGYKKRTPQDIQKLKLEKLMAHPEKEVHIPEKREPQLPKIKDFDFNVQGSSAGAGSGEFHVYRNGRRREITRQKIILEMAEREEKMTEFEKKMAEQRRKEEEKTMKNRLKRLKQKQKGQKKKANAGNNNNNNPNSEANENNEDDESDDQYNGEEGSEQSREQSVEQDQAKNGENNQEGETKEDENDEEHPNKRWKGDEDQNTTNQ
jgi:hypothetical protein